MEKEEIDVLLHTYETAQENAQHSDTVVWEAAAIIWSANALLMGFVLEAVSSPKPRVHFLIVVTSLVGITMTYFLLKSFPRLKRNQEICWQICQSIEKKLEMEFKVHCQIHEDYQSDKKIRMRVGYKVVSFVFLVAWVFFFIVSAYQFAVKTHDCI